MLMSSERKDKSLEGESSSMAVIKKAPTAENCDQEQNFCSSTANSVNSVHPSNSFLRKKKLKGSAPYPVLTFETVPSERLCVVLVLVWH